MGRRTVLAGALLALMASSALGPSALAGPRETTELGSGWRFFQGDPERAEAKDFDDATWTRVGVPHDWQIDGPVDIRAMAGGAGGFFPTGVAWYRRDLDISPKAGRRWFVELDGIMERGGVWINGHNLGFRPNGNVAHRYDITPFLRADGRNVLAVRADTSHAPSSRWYAGGGLYRKVRVVETGEAFIPADSAFIQTPVITAEAATAKVQADLSNLGAAPRSLKLEIVVTGPDGAEAARVVTAPQTIEAGRTERAEASLTVKTPKLWDIDSPNLYRATLRVLDADGKALDEQIVPFGVRTAEFKAESGFWLNGRNIKLKGVAVHEDGGAVGMAVPMAVWRQRLTKLKAMGVNAIRTAHNPPTSGFLDLTDELGFVVMDELFDQWNVSKTPGDYHLFFGDWGKKDALDIVARDRNHPSIAIWSIGNEIHDTAFPVQAKAAMRGLLGVVHAADPSRPATQGLFRPNVTGDYKNGLADLLDVVGQNYREGELIQAHKDKPSRKIVGTENSHSRASWVAVRDYPAYAGMFLWTGVDYLGESDRRGWPNIDNPAGLLDRTGAPRIRGLERESWWSEKPVIHVVRNSAPDAVPVSNDGAGPAPPMPVTIQVATPAAAPQLFADWTPATLTPHPETIEVYSNCARVSVALNGRDLGAKPLPADASPRRWPVTFEPGVVTAACLDTPQGPRAELRTAGAAARIVLEPDTRTVGAGFDEIAYVRARVVDAKGVTVPSAQAPLTFAVEGGALVATDNGSSIDHVPFKSATRAPLLGKAVALVRAQGAGPVKVTATAPGLKPGSATLGR